MRWFTSENDPEHSAPPAHPRAGGGRGSHECERTVSEKPEIAPGGALLSPDSRESRWFPTFPIQLVIHEYVRMIEGLPPRTRGGPGAVSGRSRESPRGPLPEKTEVVQQSRQES
jgi:hypothetical protein